MTHQTITPDITAKAAQYLTANDPILGTIIADTGLCSITPHRDYYKALTEEIIGQQLHVKAAASIRTRFEDLFDGSFPEPGAILEKSIEELRTAGLSRAKATYIRDLAQHVVDGSVQFDHLDALTDEEVIHKLTTVKGIGEWTAHMFLMFCMGRLDIVAYGDLGIRAGIKKLYGLDQLPTPQEVATLAETHLWHPYATIACWYIWRVLDNKPQ
jgi:DNA-3-methyladenine glycosylase II